NGHSVSHSNIKTKRSFNANLQNIKIELNGSTKKALVCTKCIKGNKVVKAK
ncbi:large ribosomal subunit protein bL28, partial [Brachyspira pilosicoli]